MLVNLDYPKGSEVQGFQGLLVTKLGKNKLRGIWSSIYRQKWGCLCKQEEGYERLLESILVNCAD